MPGEQDWREEHLLNLVDAVTKVENKRKRNGPIRDSKIRMASKEEKWEQVAENIPLSVFRELNKRSPTRYKNLAGICRRKFSEICEYFNNVFIKFERNNCLTSILMTKLAEYSKGFADQPYFFKTGPRAKYIQTDHETELFAHSGSDGEQPYFSNTRGSARETESLAQSAGQIVAECSRGFPPYMSRTGLRAKDMKTDKETESRATSTNTIPVLDCSSRVRGSSRVSRHPAPLDQLDSSAYTNSDRQEYCENARSAESPLKQSQKLRFNEKNSKFKQVEFVKKMAYSQVIRGFILRIPSEFCSANFASHIHTARVPFVLVDEDSVKWKVLYLPGKGCFSAGWGTFAKKHRLKVDDVVRFRLIKSHTFQVTVNAREAGDLKPD